jgi:hypothetical protein
MRNLAGQVYCCPDTETGAVILTDEHMAEKILNA